MGKHRAKGVWSQMVSDGFYWIIGLTVSAAGLLAAAPTIRDMIHS